MDPTATVFDIQKSCTHDGPGIRTTVFVKGCPLRCVWCHNPESWRAAPELLYSADRCRNCGKCADVCPVGAHVFDGGVHVFKRERCMACGQCVKRCPSNALELCGRTETVSGVLAEVLKDRPFYESSGGGMTLSGGEPMACFAFAEALMRAAVEAGIHTALETCGFAPVDRFERILPFTNLFLFDVKTLDPEKHRRFTGAPLESILKTLDYLNGAGAPVVLRCPLVPGLNDSPEELAGIGRLAQRLDSVSAVQVEPYHPTGVSKAIRLGLSGFHSAPFASNDATARCLVEIGRHTDKHVGLA